MVWYWHKKVLEVVFMWNKDKSVILSIAVCFILAAILTLLLFAGPWAVRIWFTAFRGMAADSPGVQRLCTLFSACFYPCAPLAYLTLYSLLRLLFNIKNENTFTTQNVKYLRRISWSCFGVALITIVGGIYYLPFLFVAVAAAFVGLLLRVVKNVMHSAAELKSENELTI